MPPATGLHFFRKKQTVDHLALERPQSLPIFRECVLQSLIAIEKRIEMLQQSYYGSDIDIEHEIKRWLPPLKLVLRQSKISYFLCKTQLEDTVVKYKRAEGDPTLEVDFDKEAIRIVLDCVEKVLQYLKTGFADIIKDMKMISDYMWKYCLSFSDTEGDSYLDTAVNYEKQRKEFRQAISFNIDDIINMAEQFETRGMRVQDLGFVARDLAERCNAVHAPFLVIIPQAFENLKNAIAGMRKWVEADVGFADFIQFDITDLEAKKGAHEKKIRDMQVQCSNCEHKVKTAKRLLSDITAEVKGFEKRDISLTKENEVLLIKNKDVLVDLDIKKFRRDELKPSLEELTEYELGVYNQLEHEIVVLSERRPVIDRKLEEINKKLETIKERKDIMKRRDDDVTEAKNEVRKMKREYRRSEVEMERMDCNLVRLKEIYRYKTTPEILKKIFHGMPLTARHVVNKGKRPIMDKLERACKLTSSYIDNDWSKLYRVLPFYPPRGEHTIMRDIDEIGKEYMRHINEDLCRQSLWRWRRMHTRACIDDLRKALLYIRRKDVVDMVDEEIARRASKPNIPSPAFRTVRFPKLMPS